MSRQGTMGAYVLYWLEFKSLTSNSGLLAKWDFIVSSATNLCQVVLK